MCANPTCFVNSPARDILGCYAPCTLSMQVEVVHRSDACLTSKTTPANFAGR